MLFTHTLHTVVFAHQESVHSRYHYENSAEHKHPQVIIMVSTTGIVYCLENAHHYISWIVIYHLKSF